MDSIVTPKPPLQILSISEEEEGKVEEEWGKEKGDDKEQDELGNNWKK
jgi:hypothetical protein